MTRYALRRLTWLPIIVFGVSALAFFVLRGLPGQDPAAAIGGMDATPEQRQRIREDLGLARPVPQQYVEWLHELVTGDFGREYRSGGGGQSDGEPIINGFKRRFPASFQLISMSLVISSVTGITFGIIAAFWRNSPFDYLVRVFAVLAASIPEFFLLTLLIIIPSYLWSYSAPVGGYVAFYDDPWTNLRLMGPAAIIIGIGGSAGLMRLTRTTMLEVLRSDYVRTAYAKGLRSRTVVVTHALRNSLTPIVTAIGTAFVAIFGGSVIAETILSIRGLGEWFFAAAIFRDLPVVQFLVVYFAAVVVLVNLIVDLSYGFIDPRVRYS
jgi:peptide/nickel transport system permease protein